MKLRIVMGGRSGFLPAGGDRRRKAFRMDSRKEHFPCLFPPAPIKRGSHRLKASPGSDGAPKACWIRPVSFCRFLLEHPF